MDTLTKPDSGTTEAPASTPGVIRRSYLKLLGGLAAVVAYLYVQAGVASAQVPTALSDGVDDIETNMLLLPTILIGTAVTIGVAFMFVRVTPKVIRWVSNRFG